MIVNNNGNVVKLYGTIYEGDGPYIIYELQRIMAAHSAIDLRLHSPGGSVIDGNLIYNFLKTSKANITIYIDGLAASMATVLMLAGTNIKMAENAYLMLHAPSGSVRGNAAEMTKIANLLAAIEDNFLSKYAKKTKKSKDELKKWMQGDNWFSAEMALEEGLIDEIVDQELDMSDLEPSGEYNLAALAAHFGQYDKPNEDPKEQTNKVVIPKNETMSKLTAQNLVALGLKDDASESQINAAIASMANKTAEAEARALKAEQRAETLQDEINAAQEARITDLVEGAILEGRITADKKEKFMALAKANFEVAKDTLAELTPAKKLPGASATGSASHEDRSAWTSKDWREKDLQGLVKMKQEDPERYQALFTK